MVRPCICHIVAAWSNIQSCSELMLHFDLKQALLAINALLSRKKIGQAAGHYQIGRGRPTK